MGSSWRLGIRHKESADPERHGDKKAYAQPWHITFFYKLKPNWRLDAHPCTLSELKKWDSLGHKDQLPGLDYTPSK